MMECGAGEVSVEDVNKVFPAESISACFGKEYNR